MLSPQTTQLLAGLRPEPGGCRVYPAFSAPLSRARSRYRLTAFAAGDEATQKTKAHCVTKATGMEIANIAAIASNDASSSRGLGGGAPGRCSSLPRMCRLI